MEYPTTGFIKDFKKQLQENRYFLIPYILLFLFAVILLLIYSKAELHIASNKANNAFFDIFFKYATNLGDGWIIAILFLGLLIIKYRYAFAFLTGSLITSIIVNVLKKAVFHEMYRLSSEHIYPCV